jgi:hypothetical protein
MAAPQSPTVLDAERAQALLTEFTGTEDLALRYPRDGCYARAHVMLKRLRDKGVEAWKVWAFASSKDDLLWVETPAASGGRVNWGYHVALLVVVRQSDGGTREMVFDPILFDRPVAVEDWASAVHDTPTLVRSAPGVTPIPARGGSGYWPGPDPVEGPDANAEEILEEYRELSRATPSPGGTLP